MAIASPLDTTAKLVGTKSMGIKMRQHDKTQWVVTKTTKLGNQKADAGDNKADNKLVNSIYFTPGCTNPPNLDYTALLDTAANISLLTPTAPALHDATTLPLFSLPKLPPLAKQTYQITGLTNNLLSAAVLADVGCEVFFHHTGCEVSYNGEIIVRGWQDPTTRLWQVPIASTEENIMPKDDTIIATTEPTMQAHSIYECKNTDQHINFYYATMGYPALATWCKAIDKGYFRGWNGLTSKRVCRFIEPSEFHAMGHLDQWRQGIRSTKAATATISLDPMETPPQLALNEKTNMVFMTMVDIQGQLFINQTGRFPITSNRGNNYIVIFYTADANHIKSYPIKSCHRTELLQAYNDVYAYLHVFGYQPQLYKLDNKSSHNVETFITENNASLYTPPEIHQTKIAEQAIHTWKNHFVAMHAGAAKSYRLSNWYK
ncbi:hypothetical protein ACHAW6_012248, partial [Cyclotella cf. meneghiniana]